MKLFEAKMMAAEVADLPKLVCNLYEGKTLPSGLIAVLRDLTILSGSFVALVSLLEADGSSEFPDSTFQLNISQDAQTVEVIEKSLLHEIEHRLMVMQQLINMMHDGKFTISTLIINLKYFNELLSKLSD